jgi:AcrR family transcriptional regulator
VSQATGKGRVDLPALPRGSHGLSRAEVLRVQRLRLIGAMAQIAGELGDEPAAVSGVVDRAGVSTSTFYALFADRHDCFLAMLEETIDEAAARVRAASGAGDDWRERIRLGLLELLVFVEEWPELARLVLARTLPGHPRLDERTRPLVRALLAAIEQARKPEDPEPLPSSAEAVLGGVAAIIWLRLQRGERELRELFGPLMGVIVAPYLGVETARRELARRPPVLAPPELAVAIDSGRLDVRITPHARRVLEVIADEPGLCNREVGEAAGIPHHSLVSSILGRLRCLGMIAKIEGPHAGPARNAWRLTPDGEARAFQPHEGALD